MGPTEVPAQSADIIKVPTANYEFGANFIDPKVVYFSPNYHFSGYSYQSHFDNFLWCFKAHAFWKDLD